MLTNKQISPLQYWKSNGSDWPTLQKVAVRLFSVVTSSAASERNFSTFGFISQKLRSRLSTDTIEKLVFVKTNASLLYKVPPDDEINVYDELVTVNDT